MAAGFFTTSTEYARFDILTVALTSFFSLIGTTSFAIALQTGRAGPV